MDDCKAVIRIMDVSSSLLPSVVSIWVNATFWEVKEALMHLMTATRPDIAVAVGYGSRLMSDPRIENRAAVKRILYYLQGTKIHSIRFQYGNKIDFRGYFDADWAGNHFDRKSTSGYAFILMTAFISWRNKIQLSVSLSTSKA